MDLPTWSALVQAASAVVIVWLTYRLSRIARAALRTSQEQAVAAEKTIAEMQKDRHLAAFPVLAIRPMPLSRPERDVIRGSLRITNASSTPALDVRVRLSEALGPGYPIFRRVEEYAGAITVIAPGVTDVEMPLDFSQFTTDGTASRPPRLEKPWVAIEVSYRGLLGAQVIQRWDWEWLDWNPAPSPGLGEKLILIWMKGTSGADGGVRDIVLDAQRRDWPAFLERDWPNPPTTVVKRPSLLRRLIPRH